MKFSAIIPAHNEGPRIQKVLEIACQSDLLDEIIVIDDGSTDDTKNKIQSFKHHKLRPIFLEKNSGKTNAVMTGIATSQGGYIVMIDSDLIGLQSRHIDELILPIKSQEADTTLSIRKDSMLICRLFGTDFLSGDRVIAREIFEDQEYFLRGKGYALEVKLNRRILEKNYAIKNVYWPDVSAPTKRSKYGFVAGTKKDILMAKEILKEVSIFEFLAQFFLFSRFSSRTNPKNHQK